MNSNKFIIVGNNKVSQNFIKSFPSKDFIVFDKKKHSANNDKNIFNYDLIHSYNFKNTKSLYYFFERYDQDFLIQLNKLAIQKKIHFYIGSNEKASASKVYLDLTDINLIFRNQSNLKLFFIRVFDLIFSLFAIAILTPVYIIISILILIEDGFPIFFFQKRVGYNGKLFTLYKFRTMKKSSEKYDESPTMINDHRITKIGRILRKSSLDEIPQFVNIFFGSMSVVGPRPEMKFIVDQYNSFERLRLKIKPGLTGLWQVSKSRNLPIHYNLDYDLYQIIYHSIIFNLKQIFKTIIWSSKGY